MFLIKMLTRYLYSFSFSKPFEKWRKHLLRSLEKTSLDTSSIHFGFKFVMCHHFLDSRMYCCILVVTSFAFFVRKKQLFCSGCSKWDYYLMSKNPKLLCEGNPNQQMCISSTLIAVCSNRGDF